ncbi:MAG: CPBP family intramembrane metalloprotease [Clostridia bacterium]|nr:CPBP family intramembrane metalloprotease [Clostridia bacterium]
MKKNYFIIISVIQIILCVFTISLSKTTATNLVNMMNELETSAFSTNNSELDAMIDFNNPDTQIGFYQRYIFVFNSIIILMSIVTIIIANNNHTLRYKKRLVFYSVFSLLFGSGLVSLIGFANLIILLVLKRTEEDDEPLPKKDIEPLEYTYRNKKGIIFGVLAILTYVILYAGIRRILTFILPAIPIEIFESILTLFSINIIVLVIILAIYKEELLKGIRAVKENFNDYRRFIVKGFLITILLSIIGNIIRIALTGNISSVNQLTLLEMPVLYLLFAAFFWAPIVEECVFRGSIRRFIPNKYVFIILSGVIFGLLHTVAEEGLANVFITAIPYGIIGMCLAAVYEKSNNIITNIAIHALNNLIGVVAIFILLGV